MPPDGGGAVSATNDSNLLPGRTPVAVSSLLSNLKLLGRGSRKQVGPNSANNAYGQDRNSGSINNQAQTNSQSAVVVPTGVGFRDADVFDVEPSVMGGGREGGVGCITPRAVMGGGEEGGSTCASNKANTSVSVNQSNSQAQTASGARERRGIGGREEEEEGLLGSLWQAGPLAGDGGTQP